MEYGAKPNRFPDWFDEHPRALGLQCFLIEILQICLQVVVCQDNFDVSRCRYLDVQGIQMGDELVSKFVRDDVTTDADSYFGGLEAVFGVSVGV